jgi:hypothetical protein
MSSVGLWDDDKTPALDDDGLMNQISYTIGWITLRQIKMGQMNLMSQL